MSFIVFVVCHWFVKCLQMHNVVIFADDTILFINGNNINKLESLINSELAEIAKWLKVNKL